MIIKSIHSPKENKQRSQNTIPKRKITKGQTTGYKTLHRKPKIEQHEPH